MPQNIRYHAKVTAYGETKPTAEFWLMASGDADANKGVRSILRSEYDFTPHDMAGMDLQLQRQSPEHRGSRRVNPDPDPLRASLGVKEGEDLPGFAWPGGYPIIYLDRDNEVLCASCASKEKDPEDQSYPVAYSVYFEGPPETCAECEVAIPSAYGDPEEEEG